jgi:hypothetical protein
MVGVNAPAAPLTAVVNAYLWFPAVAALMAKHALTENVFARQEQSCAMSDASALRNAVTDARPGRYAMAESVSVRLG